MSNQLPVAGINIAVTRRSYQLQPQPSFAILPLDLDSRILLVYHPSGEIYA